jgi:hypothetical protein
MDRAEALKKCGLSPKSFCVTCWSAAKRMASILATECTVTAELAKALRHAEERLKHLPHNEILGTDFVLIRKALALVPKEKTDGTEDS